MTRERKIQLLLWTYFWLLIFEGALRKWMLPGLSTPLLLVRDPVGIAAIALGWPYLMHGITQVFVFILYSIAAASIVFAMLFGHQDWLTALFGARIILLHFPLIFLFGAVFTINDVWKFAKALLLLSIPMTILISLQFSLPQDHIINVAPGGEGSAGFSAALDKFRPPGTFSFISGLSYFYGLSAAFFGAWVTSGPRPVPKCFWISGASLVLALPLSISRTLLYNYVIVVILSIIASLAVGKTIKRLLKGLALIFCFVMILSYYSLYNEGIKAFSARWEAASESEEGAKQGAFDIVYDRTREVAVEGFNIANQSGLFGRGIGLGTNVGAVRLSKEVTFLVSESEWGINFGEMGAFLGGAYIIFRAFLAFSLFILGIKSSFKGNTLPLILSAIAVPGLLIGQTSQPTNLGFIILSAGLMFAACNDFQKVELAQSLREPY